MGICDCYYPSALGSDMLNVIRVPPGGWLAGVGHGGTLNLAEKVSESGVPVIEVRGEINFDTAPELRDALARTISAGNYDLVVDLNQIDFLDSTGLGVLIGALRSVRAHHGSLRVVCEQTRFLKIFEITGLAKVFSIHASQEEALSRLQG